MPRIVAAPNNNVIRRTVSPLGNVQTRQRSEVLAHDTTDASRAAEIVPIMPMLAIKIKPIIKMKNYIVSVAITGFANVTVEAKNEKDAKAKALSAPYQDLEVEQHTIRQDLVESVEELH